ncbi:uncharacterized protein METZ01_LOCUS462431, partial [marine metagenome]
ESTWSKNFKKQSALRRGQTRQRQQAQQHSPGQRVPPKTKNYGEELETEANLSIPPKGSGKPVRKYGSSKGGNLSITPAGRRAEKKGDHKLSITAKGRAAVEDMSLAPKGKGRKAAKALYKEEDIDMPSLVAQAINELTPDQKKKREASRERTHGGDEYKKMAHAADRGQKKPDRNVRKIWQKAPSMRAGPKGKLPEDIEVDEGEWADEKRKERESSARLLKIHNEREKRYQAQQAAKKKAGAKKEERDPP